MTPIFATNYLYKYNMNESALTLDQTESQRQDKARPKFRENPRPRLTPKNCSH